MALSGNFRRKLGNQDKAPKLKHAVRFRDNLYLPGSTVPNQMSKRQAKALKRGGYLEDS